MSKEWETRRFFETQKQSEFQNQDSKHSTAGVFRSGEAGGRDENIQRQAPSTTLSALLEHLHLVFSVERKESAVCVSQVHIMITITKLGPLLDMWFSSGTAERRSQRFTELTGIHCKHYSSCYLILCCLLSHAWGHGELVWTIFCCHCHCCSGPLLERRELFWVSYVVSSLSWF